MKVLHNIYIAIIVFILSIFFLFFTIFELQLSRVSRDKTVQEVVIERGSIEKVAKTLYDKKLIKNVFAFKLYCRLTGKVNLQAATYSLSPNMGSKKIVNILNKGKGANSHQISITFKEGKDIPNYISIIVDQTNIKEEDILTVLKDKSYLKELIDTYWFLSDDILNDDLYYSLEGYLYPDTYFFSSKNINIKDVFKTLLDETDKKISPYKDQITHHHLSVHEIFTLASIVELEGVDSNDRKGIAGVFFNRLSSKMTLGSDVTSYYAAHIHMGDRDLYASEVSDCNHYNTRCSSFIGLPVGPICNPTVSSIEAVLNPNSSDYYYFVADKNKKVYFSKNINEHNRQINQLKRQGLWFEY